MHTSALNALRSPAAKKCLPQQRPAIKSHSNLWVHVGHGQEVPSWEEEHREKWKVLSHQGCTYQQEKTIRGLSGAQDPLCDEVPGVVLGSHVGWSGV